MRVTSLRLHHTISMSSLWAALLAKPLRRVRGLARTALLEYNGQADARQEIMLRLIQEYIAPRLTGRR